MLASGPIAIIGAGMAGLACGEELSASGQEVRLFDKGRGPGGRMSTRRITIGDTEVGFDHGAQYFTARDGEFLTQVNRWQKEGIVTPWLAAGDDAWVGMPSMNAPLADMASRLHVRYSSRIDRLESDGNAWRLIGKDLDSVSYAAVIVAIPAEQVPELTNEHCPSFALAAKAIRSDPCWTVMVAFSEPLVVKVDVLKPHGDIIWAARNSSKPGRGAVETWVIQASADWSRRYKGALKADVVKAMLSEFENTISHELPEPLFEQAHNWLYARSGSNGYGYLWDRTIGIGVCGDWLIGPRVECAWHSGRALARAMTPSWQGLAP